MIPYHLDTDGEYSYHRFVNSGQWMDYSGGLIFGKRFNKSFGIFAEASTTSTGMSIRLLSGNQLCNYLIQKWLSR